MFNRSPAVLGEVIKGTTRADHHRGESKVYRREKRAAVADIFVRCHAPWCIPSPRSANMATAAAYSTSETPISGVM